MPYLWLWLRQLSFIVISIYVLVSIGFRIDQFVKNSLLPFVLRTYIIISIYNVNFLYLSMPYRLSLFLYS